MSDCAQVMFTRSIDIIPLTKGIYKDLMKDVCGFQFAVTKTVAEYPFFVFTISTFSKSIPLSQALPLN